MYIGKYAIHGWYGIDHQKHIFCLARFNDADMVPWVQFKPFPQSPDVFVQVLAFDNQAIFSRCFIIWSVAPIWKYVFFNKKLFVELPEIQRDPALHQKKHPAKRWFKLHFIQFNLRFVVTWSLLSLESFLWPCLPLNQVAWMEGWWRRQYARSTASRKLRLVPWK